MSNREVSEAEILFLVYPPERGQRMDRYAIRLKNSRSSLPKDVAAACDGITAAGGRTSIQVPVMTLAPAVRGMIEPIMVMATDTAVVSRAQTLPSSRQPSLPTPKCFTYPYVLPSR